VSLLSRTPTSPTGRLATSTQLLLEKLRDLLIQCGSELGLPEEVTERGEFLGFLVSPIIVFTGIKKV